MKASTLMLTFTLIFKASILFLVFTLQFIGCNSYHEVGSQFAAYRVVNGIASDEAKRFKSKGECEVFIHKNNNYGSCGRIEIIPQ